MYLASNDELSQQVGRKAMILLTDGEDQGSQMRITDAIEAAQRSGSIIYVLLCADLSLLPGSGEYSGKGKMKKLTEATGGRVIVVGNKLANLKDAFRQIAGELCNQYNIGYTPTNTALTAPFVKTKSTSRQDYRIQARTGYYAVPTRN